MDKKYFGMKAQQTTLDKIRSRPRFKIHTNMSPEKYHMKLKKFLENHKDSYSGTVNFELATISVITSEDTYWKPYLTLRAKEEDGHTVIRGVFGPGANIWTLFMFLYFIFSVLWMVFFTLWFVGIQIKSDEYIWGLSASFVMLVLLGLVYYASYLGKKKAVKEMALLRKFAIDSSLKYEDYVEEE